MSFDRAKELFLNGLTLLNENDFKGAEQSFQASLNLLPNRASSLTNLSAAQIKLKKFPDAKHASLQAIAIEENNSEAYFNLGVIENEMGNFSEAIKHLNKCTQLNPYYYEAWSSAGIAQSGLKQHEEAIASYDKAISINPNYHEAWSNRGMALEGLRLNHEAIASYDKAISINPNYHEAWSNRGLALAELRLYHEAIASYNKAISINPNYFDAHWNKALSQLITGNFKEGWANYEYRWKCSFAKPLRHQQYPRLTALSDAVGKRVLVWCEQGYGDTIQFSRLINELRILNIDIIFEVQKPLKGLINNSFPSIQVIGQGELFEEVDFQIPLASLPLLLQVVGENIPSNSPYLFCTEANSRIWMEKLNLPKDRLNIGIACSGNINYGNDKNRPIPLSKFEPLAKISNLYLIQAEIRDTDLNFFKSHAEIRFMGDHIKTFDDSASILNQMDLIITIDTSLAHLSGALGKPTYLLISWAPDWRWLLNTDQSPWYPTLKIVRQSKINNWEAAINYVVQQLRHKLP